MSDMASFARAKLGDTTMRRYDVTEARCDWAWGKSAPKNGGLLKQQGSLVMATCLWGSTVAYGRAVLVCITRPKLRRCAQPPQASGREITRMRQDDRICCGHRQRPVQPPRPRGWHRMLKKLQCIRVMRLLPAPNKYLCAH